MKKVFLLVLLCSYSTLALFAQQPPEDDIEYAAVDAFVTKKPPSDIDKGVTTLSQYLTQNWESDFDKIRAISVWIAYNIVYDVKTYLKREYEKRTAANVLKSKKGINEDFAVLFNAMCKEAGFTAVSVPGYAKTIEYEDGDTLYKSNHVWNAVMIDSTWYLIDLTMASGYLVRKETPLSNVNEKLSGSFYSKSIQFKKDFNSAYFLVSPKEFAYTHIPLDPMWQLNHQPLSLDDFEAGRAAITAHHKTSQSAKDTAINFEKKIVKYIEGDELYRQVVAANNSRKFNKRNHRVQAYNYGAYANLLSTKDGSFKNAMKQGVKYYEMAIENGNLYKEDNKSNYKNEKAKLKLRNQTILKPNRAQFDANKKRKKEFRQLKKKAKIENKTAQKTIAELEKKNRATFNDNLNDVERTKKSNEKKEKAIAENTAILKENNAIIESLKPQLEPFAPQVDKDFETIKENWKEARNTYLVAPLMIDTLMQLNVNDRKLSQIQKYEGDLDSIRQIYNNALERNQTLKKNIAAQLKARSVINDSIIGLLKANKKLIRKNMKFSVVDQGEKASYAAANQLLEEMYKQKNRRYYQSIAYNNDWIEHLREEKKLGKEENRILKKEKGVEDARFNRLSKHYKYIFDWEKQQIVDLLKNAKSNMSRMKRKI